jgi:hypothetical protein
VGTALTKEGQWVEALAQFERSARLHPHAVTTYDIGFCERALGRYTRARRSFGRALSAGGELPADLAAEARGYLAEIESRLSRALVALHPEGAAVAVDGRPLEVVAAEGPHVELVAGTRDPGPAEIVPRSFSLVIDPGPHVIVVRAAGAPERVVTRTFDAGATVPLVLDVGPAPAPPKPAPPARSWRAGAIAAFSGGALGLGAAALFGGLALGKRNDLEGVCAARCPHTAQPTVDAMNAFAGASTAGAVVAGVGAALGTVLWIAAPSREPAPRGPAGLWIGPSRVEVRASF